MIFDYFKIKTFSKRNIIAAAFIPVIMLAFYNWFISPQIQYIKAAQKLEESVDKVEKNNKIIDAQIRTGRIKLDSIAQQFEQKKQEFFDNDIARDFLGSIQSQAEKNNCAVDTLKFLPENPVVRGDINSVDISRYQANLTVSGQYAGIVKLLNSLQNRKQKVWIDSINLHLKDQMSGLLVCDLSLSIYTLNIKEIESDVNNKK